jgi:hypothetical protein
MFHVLSEHMDTHRLIKIDKRLDLLVCFHSDLGCYVKREC